MGHSEITRDNPDHSSEKATWLDALIFAAMLILMLAGLGRYGLYEPHEAHFAGVGREMVTRGDWVTPHLNGAPYLNKPPLLYWFIALSYTVLGTINEFAARLPLALIGFAGCVISWQWARELSGIKAARMAAVMLMASAGWYLFSHQLMIELLLCVLYLASSYLLWKAIGEPDRRKHWAAFYVMVALNVLAKGPVGLAMSACVLMGFAACRRDGSLLRKSRPLMGAMIILVLTAPWLTLMELRNPGYLRYALISENVNRALDRRWPPDYDVVKVGVIPFLLAGLVWLAPWSLLAPQVVAYVREFGRTTSSGTAKNRDGIAILALTALVPLLFFIPIKARLVYYQLPLLAPAIILVALWFAAAHQERYRRGRLGAAMAFVVAGLAIGTGGFWVPGVIETIRDLKAAPGTVAVVDNIAFILGVAMLAGGALLYKGRPGWAVLATVSIFFLASLHNLEGFLAFDAVRSSRRVVGNLRDKVGPECIWISEGSKEVGASAGIGFYLGVDAKGRARHVYVMKDGDINHRAPPKFPYGEPHYLIDQTQLNEFWVLDKPVLFVTDFQRKSWESDRPRLPTSAATHSVEIPVSGHRRVYANEAAWKLLKDMK